MAGRCFGKNVGSEVMEAWDVIVLGDGPAALHAAAEAAKKNKGKPAAVEEVEEEAPQVRWESAPPNFLDNLFKDEDFLPTKGPCSTLTLKNGLIVRHMPNGDVV